MMRGLWVLVLLLGVLGCSGKTGQLREENDMGVLATRDMERIRNEAIRECVDQCNVGLEAFKQTLGECRSRLEGCLGAGKDK